jgi:HK97 gp10 family phage protein
MAIKEFKTEGLTDLYKKMQELPVAVEKKIMRGAMSASLKVIQKVAQENVPERNGDLKKSIKVSFSRRGLKKGWINAKVTAGDEIAYYAHMIEFGTASFYTGTGKSKRQPYKIAPQVRGSLKFGNVFAKSVTHHGNKPQPFMRPALDSSTAEALKVLGEYVANRLPKELAKVGK